MTIQEAIERLSKEKKQLSDAIECSLSSISERNDWGGLVQAIDTVLAELKESKKEGKWKPKKGEEYWHRDDIGGICWTMWDSCEIDIWRYKNIPIFPTQEACEKYWHFMDTVKEKSYEFSNDEWEDKVMPKWRIDYLFNVKKLKVDNTYSIYSIGTTYFKTKQDAQYIIDNFKEELLKYWL